MAKNQALRRQVNKKDVAPVPRKKAVTKATKVLEVKPAGSDHQVVTVTGGKGSYRRKVCGGCPWRCDTVGDFPPEAFAHSASTAYDMAQNTFACHEVGSEKPAICAGFLLRGAEHNLRVRLMRIQGQYRDDVVEPAVPLHKNYRSMAIANGLAPGHPSLVACRD